MEKYDINKVYTQYKEFIASYIDLKALASKIIEQRQLSPVMNDTKWLELQTAILSIPEFEPAYNIGVRPTIGNGPNRTIEVNILHFHSDIYDKFIRLTFVKRTRPELKYDSIDELIAQLHKDAEETEAILLAAKQEK